MTRTSYLLMLLALSVVGCTETRHYQVILRNDTAEALTIGLTGGMPDRIWNSPEDLAIGSPQDTDRSWGKVVPAGKLANTPMVKGKFMKGDPAFLRVYGNGDQEHLDFSRLLAISRGSANRLDLRLFPGVNYFIVREEAGVLQGLRLEHPTNR